MTLEPQGALSLEEYLITCKDEIKDRLQTYTDLLVKYEERLVKSFVVGMSDEKQRSILASKLGGQAWTWQIAFDETKRISRLNR